MSKIQVPEELQQLIIDLYVNKLYTRKKIKTELNLPFGDSVILRILQEHQIEIRSNPGAQQGGRKKKEVSFELQKKIIDCYQHGWGLNKIVTYLDLPFGFTKVKNILEENNIHIRNCQEANQIAEKPDTRKYSINDDYNLVSHNGAWLLGFIAADGYLPITKGAKNRIIITLARKDEEILYRIRKELSYTGKISQFTTAEGYDCSSLSFTSNKLRKQIENFGIGNNKTFQLKHLPSLPDEYLLDFIRGFIDGDGCILEPSQKKINIGLTCASKAFLTEIIEYLNFKLGLTIPTLHETIRVHKIYDIKYYTKDSFTLGHALYDNDYMALTRKKNHFLEICKKYS